MRVPFAVEGTFDTMTAAVVPVPVRVNHTRLLFAEKFNPSIVSSEPLHASPVMRGFVAAAAP